MGGKKKSKNQTTAERAGIKQVKIKLVDDCKNCMECGRGRAYVLKHRYYKESNKLFVGKGVACHR